jgi:hypothetical protein
MTIISHGLLIKTWMVAYNIEDMYLQVMVGNIKYLMNPPTGGNPNVSSHRGSGGPPIDFTQPGHNTYIRGITNNLGNTVPSGFVGNGSFMSSGNGVTM